MSTFPTSVATQLAPFEKITFYDAPGVIFSQLWDGELTAAGFRNTLINPAALSPEQRDTILTRIKAASGNNPFVSVLTDIALNPWVWLFFVTGPSAGSLTKGVGGIFRTSKAYSGFTVQNASILSAVGGTTLLQELRGTPVGPIADQAGAAITRLRGQAAAIYAVQFEKVLEKYGLTSLDPTRLRGVKAVQAEEISTKMRAVLERWDQPKTLRVPKLLNVKEMEELIAAGDEATPEAVLSFLEVKQPALTTADVTAELRALGPEVVELTTAIRRMLDERLVTMFGVEGAATFVADPRKILRVWKGLRANELFNGARTKAQTAVRDTFGQIFGEELREMVVNGKVSEKDFRALVASAFEGPLATGTYFPRTYTEVVGRGGRTMTASDLRAMQSGRMFASTRSAIHRTRSTPLFHPDDFATIDRWLGLSDDGADMATQASRAMTDALAANRPIRFTRLNPAKALDTYVADSSRTIAWHGDPVGPEVLEAQRTTYPFAEGVSTGVRPHFATFGPGNKNAKFPGPPLDTVMDVTVKEMEDLAGGWTLADALWASYALNPNESHRTLISHVVIPAVSGSLGVRHTVSLAAEMQAKRSLGWLAETRIAKAIEGSGTYGKAMVQTMREMSDFSRIEAVGSQGWVKWLSKYLYVTHLGINMSSVLLNIMQPALLASVFLPVENVLAGYKKAFGEAGRYITRRIGKFGIGQITVEERTRLLAETIEAANVEGEDLLKISQSVWESLEGVGFASLRPFETGPRAKFSGRFMELLMKPFEKAEWMNRMVTAYAVEDFYRVQGLAPSLKQATGRVRAQMKTDIRTMVAETQFGATPMNTPITFLTDDREATPLGRILANPLMRQFLQFQLRSLTGFIRTAPRLAGREPNQFAWNIMNDFARGTAISAMLYEVGKGTLGLDLERAGFISSITDLIPGISGGKFQQDDEVFPLPPFIDIGKNLAWAFFTGDREFLQQSIPRMVPGGIALAKVTGFFPTPDRYPGPLATLARTFQKTYVDWDKPTPEGLVPVFRGDGTLIDFQKPHQLILRGLGVPLQSASEAGRFDHFLTQNRDEIVRARQEMMRHLLGNHVSRAMRVRRDFEKKFGYPLTLDRRQLKAAIKIRTIPRTERILDRLPPDARPVYQRLTAATRGSRLGIAPEVLRSEATASRRIALANRPQTVSLDPETIEALRNLLEESDGSAPEAVRAFPGFGR